MYHEGVDFSSSRIPLIPNDLHNEGKNGSDKQLRPSLFVGPSYAMAARYLATPPRDRRKDSVFLRSAVLTEIGYP
jgi:hypothetical protein